MKKIKLIVLIYCFYNLTLYSQTKDHLNFKSLYFEQLDLFLDTITKYYKSNADYLVFVTKFNNVTKKTRLSITYGYILNSHQMEYIDYNYIIYYRDFPVLIHIKENQYKNIADHDFKKIDSTDVRNVKAKLYPSDDGGFNFTAKGVVFEVNLDSLKRTFYNNASIISIDKSIYSTTTKSKRKLKRIK